MIQRCGATGKNIAGCHSVRKLDSR